MEQEAVELRWEKPHFYLGEEVFTPLVQLGTDFIASSSSVNAVVIRIDGRLKADLNWKIAREQAQKLIQQGYYILWEIELGLFSDLCFSLATQTQYLSLGLSLEYFRDTIWKDFRHRSLGLIVYRGYADFSLNFQWDEQQVSNLIEWLKDHFTTETLSKEIAMGLSSLEEIKPFILSNSEIGKRLLSFFCRDVAMEYILLLINRLPDTLPCYILLDAQSISHSPLWQAQLLNPECFELLNLAVKGTTLSIQSIAWDDEILKFQCPAFIEVPLGICLPPLEMHPSRYTQRLEKVLNQLVAKQIPFRLIPESHLITSWDGLDDLIFVPEGLSSQGKRKLQGFCAAGGTVVTLGQKMGLACEMDLADLMKKYSPDF